MGTARIGFYDDGSGSIYAFFDDGGANPQDFDYDDMFIKISLAEGQTDLPLPGALPLFAGGLGLLGWLARRRKRQDVVSLSAA